MRLIARLLLPAVLVAFLPAAARAEDEASWSVQFLSGYYAKLPVGPGSTPFNQSSTGRDKIDYVPLSLRLGYECPWLFLPDTCVQGTFEPLFEYNTLVITKQFGSYFTGPSALLRYNYVQPDCLLVPYCQGGAGIVFTDAYREPVQRLIGRWQEFLLQAAVGVHVLVTAQLSLDVEGGFQHISNASLASRNGGINNAGFMVGVTYTFGGK
jgi:opacity protein-like surface antigen